MSDVARAVAVLGERECEREMRWTQRLPEPLLDEYEWQERGRCRTHAVAVFFDFEDTRGSERLAQADIAKAVCRTCEVRVQCLQHALAAEDFGVWGGTTGPERRALRTASATTVS